MTDVELQAIRERLKAATPGPWVVTRGYERLFFCGVRHDSAVVDGLPMDDYDGEWFKITDAIFIANAPTDIEALLAEVERVQHKYDELVSKYDTLSAHVIAAQKEDKAQQIDKLKFDLLHAANQIDSGTLNANKLCETLEEQAMDSDPGVLPFPDTIEGCKDRVYEASQQLYRAKRELEVTQIALDVARADNGILRSVYDDLKRRYDMLIAEMNREEEDYFNMEDVR